MLTRFEKDLWGDQYARYVRAVVAMFETPEEIDLFLDSLDRQRYPVHDLLMAVSKKNISFQISYQDALLLENGDVDQLDAYLDKIDYGYKPTVQGLIAFARKKESVEAGREYVRNTDGVYKKYGQLDVLARIGEHQADVSEYAFVRQLFEQTNNELTPASCAEVLEHVAAIDELLRVVYGQEDSVRNITSGALEGLVALVPVARELSEIASIIREQIDYTPSEPYNITPDMVQDLSRYNRTALEGAVERHVGHSDLGLANVLLRLQLQVRMTNIDPDVLALIDKHSVVIPGVTKIADIEAVARPDFDRILDVRSRLEAIDIGSYRGADWKNFAIVHDQELLPAIEYVVAELGFPTSSLERIINLIEGGAVDVTRQMVELFGVQPKAVASKDIDRVRLFLQNQDAMRSAQLCHRYFAAEIREQSGGWVTSVTDYQTAPLWSDAGIHIREFDAYLRIAHSSTNELPNIRDFESFRQIITDDEAYQLTGVAACEPLLDELQRMKALSAQEGNALGEFSYAFNPQHVQALNTLGQEISQVSRALSQLAGMMTEVQIGISLGDVSQQSTPADALNEILAHQLSYGLSAGRLKNGGIAYPDDPVFQRAIQTVIDTRMTRNKYSDNLEEVDQAIAAFNVPDAVVSSIVADRIGAALARGSVSDAEATAAQYEKYVHPEMVGQRTYSFATLEEILGNEKLRVYGNNDPWAETSAALLNIQQRSSRAEHDPWVQQLEPLVTHLIKEGLIDRNSTTDGERLVDFVRRFGMINVTVLAELFIEMHEIERFDELDHSVQEQLRLIIGTRAERMDSQQLLNELGKYQTQVRSDLLDDRVPHGMSTEIGRELFAAMRGTTAWGRGHDDQDLCSYVLERNLDQMIADTQQVLSAATLEEVPEQSRQYIRARLAHLVAETPGRDNLERRRAAYAAMEREWGQKGVVAAFERYRNPDAPTRIKPGYQEVVMRVPELVRRQTEEGEKSMTDQQEREYRISRMLQRTHITEKNGVRESHVTPLGALVGKIEDTFASFQKTDTPGQWWEHAVAEVADSLRADPAVLEQRIREKRLELEEKGVEPNRIEKTVQAMERGFMSQQEKVQRLISQLESASPLLLSGEEKAAQLDIPQPNEPELIAVMEAIQRSKLKSSAIDALLMRLSVIHMNGSETGEGHVTQLADLATSLDAEQPLSQTDLKKVSSFIVDYLTEHYLHPKQDSSHTGHAQLSKNLLKSLQSAWQAKGDVRERNVAVKTHAEIEKLLSADMSLSDTMKEVTLVPGVGAMRVYSGDVGDACYTSKHVPLAKGEYPGLTAMTFVTNRNTPQEQFAGSVLFVETTTADGRSVLHIRANNPRENLIKQVDAENLMDQVIDAAIETAKRRGIQMVTLPLDKATASCSNRKDVADVYHKKYTNAEKVEFVNEPETNFNGYDNWNPNGRYPSVIVWTAEGGRVDRQES